MSELKGFQKKYLRGRAHTLKPLVWVGREGVSASVVASVDQALTDHELIKIRFHDHKEQKKDLAVHMAQEVEGALVGMIGHVAILFRAHPDPEKRTIELPGVS